MRQAFQCLSCGATYTDRQRDGSIYLHACSPLPPNKERVQFERPARRDEQLEAVRVGRTPGIRSEGKGVRCLSNPALTEPEWISALKARAEKEAEQ